VVPILEIGTDRHRLDSYTYDVAVNQNMVFAGYGEERFSHFRKTFGYANSPLDGLWLRAPYLHNGSVPTLRDLLEPSDKRPKTFYRGYDVYDQKKVGFVADVSNEKGREYFEYNTDEPGNSNKGHEGKRYGTELPVAEKDALIEYLKTF
jgi:cytochrome c peroxidase